MKKLLLVVVAMLSLSIANAQSSKKELIAELFTNVMVMADVSLDDQLPIKSINDLAAEKADTTLVLTRDNVAEMLKIAAGFKAVYVTVGVHTIAKITDLNDCRASGAWGTCMPKAEGYVQKGELLPKSDYLNNVIGIPDGQTRMIYMFK